MTIIREIYQKLSAAGYQSPQLWAIAGWIAKHIAAAKAEQQKLELIIYDLTVRNKPLAYILGTVPFCSLELEIKEPILIPRPETEEWVLQLIALLSPRPAQTLQNILDIGTGSGCIALALAHAYPHAQVIATDSSDHALALAGHNQKRLGIANVLFTKADLFPQTAKKFDTIVSNPPYIAEEVWRTLEPSVRLWEDKQALVAADHGQAIIKRIIKEARANLVPGGILAIEIGYDQAHLYTFMQSCGYTNVHVWHDCAQKPRLLVGSYAMVQN